MTATEASSTPNPIARTGSTGSAGAAVWTVERFAGVLAGDPTTLSVDEVRGQMRLVRSVQAVAAAHLLALDERMRQIAANAESVVPVDPQRELCRHGGLRRRDARSMDSQAAAAVAAPVIGRLLAEGATTAAHLDVLGQALHIAGEGRDDLLDRVDEIAQRAVTASVDEFDRFVKRLARDAQPDEGVGRFERQRQQTFCKLWSDTDGMTRLSAAFDPERGAAIAGCLDRHVEALFHSGDRDHRDAGGLVVASGVDLNDHRRAIALHGLCSNASFVERDVAHLGRSAAGDSVMNGDVAAAPNAGGEVTQSPGLRVAEVRPARAEVIVHIDLHTLRTGLHGNSVCRTSYGADLPPDTIRRLACEADIIPVVLDGRSVPLDVGRAKRLATVHQRRALEAVHDSCAVPHCDVGFSRCVIHHLHPWEHGGGTDLSNMVPLCSTHHHAVHEGGWTMHLDPTTRHVSAVPGNGRHGDIGCPVGTGSRVGNGSQTDNGHQTDNGPLVGNRAFIATAANPKRAKCITPTAPG
jgi:hypothetical protein